MTVSESEHRDLESLAGQDAKDSKGTCFIAMPISDMTPYAAGHFDRVYQHIIRPACEAAGFKPSRADEVRSSNLIIGSIIRSLVQAEIVIADLSGRNPNVMYELGIRQAFNLPTVLMKDELTERVFDVQPLRGVEYNHTLRIDTVADAVDKLAGALVDTYRSHIEQNGEINSLIQLINITPAELPKPVTVSKEAALILDAIQNLSLIAASNSTHDSAIYFKNDDVEIVKSDGVYASLKVGDEIDHQDHGRGVVRRISDKFAVIDYGGRLVTNMRDVKLTGDSKIVRVIKERTVLGQPIISSDKS